MCLGDAKKTRMHIFSPEKTQQRRRRTHQEDHAHARAKLAQQRSGGGDGRGGHGCRRRRVSRADGALPVQWGEEARPRRDRHLRRRLRRPLVLHDARQVKPFPPPHCPQNPNPIPFLDSSQSQYHNEFLNSNR
jgi:hypothetical protein